MEKKHLQKLTDDDLIKIFNANEELQDKVLHDMIDSEMMWIEEKLVYFKDGLSDWGISPYYGVENMTVKDADKFIYGIDKMQKSVPAFPDSDDTKVEEAVKIADEYNNAEMYTDEYYSLEEKVENQAKKLVDMFSSHVKDTIQYCYDTENQKSYFCEFFSSERLSEDCYILADENGNSDYVLYEDISYVKKYNQR